MKNKENNWKPNRQLSASKLPELMPEQAWPWSGKLTDPVGETPASGRKSRKLRTPEDKFTTKQDLVNKIHHLLGGCSNNDRRNLELLDADTLAKIVYGLKIAIKSDTWINMYGDDYNNWVDPENWSMVLDESH